MFVGAVNLCALVTLAAAAISLRCLEQNDRNSLRLLAAGAGIFASVALIVSAILLADGWATWAGQFYGADFVPLDKWSRGGFPFIGLLSWPYEAIALGGFCLYAFGRKLYRLAWIAGWI